MAELRIERPVGDDAVRDWQHVHNVVVPPAAMSFDEARERVTRYRLEVVYDEGALVGCTTVRPPSQEPEDAGTATVIVRVLPEARRRGIGAQLYTRALAQAHELGATAIETVVWTGNPDGVRFAEARGFVEVSRFAEDPDFITMRLA